MLNNLNNIIAKQFTGAQLSCPDCECTNGVKATESNTIGYNNPLGERRMTIYCDACGHADEAIQEADVIATVKKWLVSTAARYICHYKLNEEKHSTELPHGVLDVNPGFWIDLDHNYTQASDVYFWIPAGQVLYVEKDNTEKRLG